MDAGTTLSHYTITRLLGQGGMGEVFLAEDTKLKRQVALKVLPPAVRHDPQRLARFRTEAEAAAKLNHPNVAQIHSIEEADDQLFITMEYVAGDTLKAHIPTDGLAVDQFFDWFIALADALAHAHEKGVTHRDIKPGNIMVTPEGIPKILDFGLARITRDDVEPEEMDSEAPTATLDHEASPEPRSLTQGRVFLGTPMYMSPEQAESKKVDARTDLFSFGVVMYEALTGQRPFQGETVESIVGRILTEEPKAVTALKPVTPYPLWSVIRRCLKKDREERIQTARVLLAELRDIQHEVQDGTVLVDAKTMTAASEPPVAVRRLRTLLPIVVTAMLAALATHWFVADSGNEDALVRKFPLTVKLWHDPGLPGGQVYNGPALSPDGTSILYTFQRQLWIRMLSQDTPFPLPGTEGAQRPFWAPDSKRFGYFRWSETVTAHLHTGSTVGTTGTLVCDIPIDRFPRGAAWMPDDRILVSLSPTNTNNGRLYTVPSTGGELQLSREPDSTQGEFGILYPHLLPDGKTLLYTAVYNENGGAIIAVDDTDRTVLHEDGKHIPTAAVYSATGHVVYQLGLPQSTGLWGFEFDISAKQRTGEPFRLTTEGNLPSVSKDGTLLYRGSEKGGLQQLVWVDRTGRITGTIGQPQEDIRQPAISPDGSQVAASSFESGNRDIWLHETDRVSARLLVASPLPEDNPVWMPDGNYLIYSETMQTGRQQIKQFSLKDNSSHLLNDPEYDARGPSISFDGRYVLYTLLNESGRLNKILYQDMMDATPARPLLDNRFNNRWAVLSPDSRHVAYASTESGRQEVYIMEFPDGGRRISVSSGATGPRWRYDGSELYYVEPTSNTLMAVPVTRDNNGLRMGLPKPLFSGDSINATLGTGVYRFYDVRRDGQRFVVVQNVAESGNTTMMIVQNWYAQFKDK